MNSEQSNTKAAAWMAGGIACFLMTSVAGRALTPPLDVFQVMVMRSLVGLVLLMPLVHRNGGFAGMRTGRPVLHIARNIVHYSGQFAWLYALALIPLGQLISIEFTSPIWTALLAVTFLGERLTRPKLTAVVLGLIGIIIIVRPGVTAIQVGHLAVLAAALFFGISLVMTKSLTRTDNVVKIIFWMLVIQSIIGLPPALMVWKNPPMELWPWIVVIGFTGSFSHYCLTRALTHADATLVAPIDFLRVPLSALLGWLLYHEQIDIWTASGAALILAGNLFNLQRRTPPKIEAIPP